MSQDERFALVAGASSGMGYEISQYLLDEGFTVFGISRSGCDIDDPQFINLEIDMRDEESIAIIKDTLDEDVFGLSVVVNCLGVFDMIAIDDMDSETMMDHLQTHVLGAFHLLKASRDFLLEGETHFIHLSSLVSTKGVSNLSAYSASKAALERLIESCREEWSGEGVRFSTLVPGAVNTPLWDNLSEYADDFNRSEMLGMNDLLHVFDMVIKSPPTMHFPRLTFAHRDGVLG